jgi:hypothetical protein
MRKITLMVVALFSSAMAFGQYYYWPGLPGNPGGLNNDIEEPKGYHDQQGTGWAGVQGPSGSATWSAAQNIPFTFNFNGANRSQYKVSTTGVVTFDITASSAPSAGAVALPNANVPDNSICVLGLDIVGSNDYVISKTFGTSPNRQHWIHFASATVAGNSQTYTYWSIVLEETTNNVYIVDQRHAGTLGSFSLGLQFSSSSAVSVQGSPNLAPLAGGDNTPVDNFHYTFIQGTQPQHDVANLGITNINEIELLTNAPFNIGAEILNLGSATVNTLDMHYQVNGGTVYTSPAGSLNLNFGQSTTVTHANAWTPTASGQYEIAFWTSNINGNPDASPGNDTAYFSVIVVTSSPERIVVIEEKTGTWCGWCPRGTVGMEYMDATYGSTSATIAVHNNDPMVVQEYDSNIGAVAPGGYPGSSVDRILGPDPNQQDLEQAYNDRRAAPTYAQVMEPEFVSYDWTTRKLMVKVQVKFTASVTGNY